MAEEKRTSSGGQSKPRKKRKKQRSLLSRIAGAFLYVIFILGASAILATVGWTWANDLLALNKDYTSVIITINDDMFVEKTVELEDGSTTTVTAADMGPIIDQLESEGLIEYKFLFKLFSWFSSADQKITAEPTS